MNKINKKITLFSLLTCGLLGASGGGDSSPQIDSNGLTSQVFGSVSREGYFPSVSNCKTCGKAVGPIALKKLDEYKKYFRLQDTFVTLHGNRNDESEIKYINDMKEHFLIQIMYSIRLFENNDPKIMPFKNLFKWREKECTGYIQDHLLDILMALTSDNPRVAALGLPPLDQIEDKESAIDQILDTLAPDLDQCDEDTENRILARLIDLTRDDPRVAALGLPPLDQITNKKQAINDILDIVCPIRTSDNNYISRICDEDTENRILARLIDLTRDDPRVAALGLPPLDQITNKKQAINDILDIVCPIRTSNNYISKIINSVHNNYKNNMELIALIRRNRRNIKEFDDYSTLLYNNREEKIIAQLKDFRPTAAIMQTAKDFNQNSE